MDHKIRKLMALIFLMAMAGYAHAYTWKDVNRTIGPVKPKSEAYLKVYSEARVYRDGDIPRVDRMPYTIYSTNGKKIKWVAFNDEDPKLVTLPPGKYVIVPETNITKRQVVGAILKPGQLTEVHMKGEDPTYAPYQF